MRFRRPLRPSRGDEYTVQNALHLLVPHGALIRRIRRHVGLPGRHWHHFYMGAIERYASFCQLLPASEAHHHCDAGGLLRHGLETLENALVLRAGTILPPGAAPEEAALQQDAWTWALSTAALLHDVGKPISDMTVLLTGSQHECWDPWREPFIGNTGATRYRIRYHADRKYRMHERLGLLLAERILPTGGISWIASYRALFAEWTAMLTGDHEHAPALAELILAAEQRSVAQDLGSARPRAATGSRAKPLAERLATALRYLIDEGELPINRDGAAAWVAGDSLWLVSKRGLDAMREHMNREGQTGIPGRNDRLMDELQQHGWLVPQGDRAIWKARVFADGWPKAHELTFLRFPVERLWPNPETRPAPFVGCIDPLAEGASSESSAQKGRAEPVETSDARDIESVTPEISAGGPDGVGVSQPDQASDSSQLSSPSRDVVDDVSDESPISASLPEQYDGTPASNVGEDTDPGQAFLTWLRAGLRDRHFQVNNANARIHRVQEGLFLVSPRIFKDFDREHWSKAQKRFQKLRINRKAPDGTNIWAYTVQGGKHVLKGFLIEDEALEDVFPGIPLPGPNPHLEHLPEGDDGA